MNFTTQQLFEMLNEAVPSSLLYKLISDVIDARARDSERILLLVEKAIRLREEFEDKQYAKERNNG